MAGISVVSPGAGSRAARTLGGVAELLGATLVAFEARPSDVARRQVEGASIDTRTLRAGEMFVALGAQLVQADQISHQLMQPGEPVYEEVVGHFGEGSEDLILHAVGKECVVRVAAHILKGKNSDAFFWNRRSDWSGGSSGCRRGCFSRASLAKNCRRENYPEDRECEEHEANDQKHY